MSKTIKEIADELGVSKTTIRNKMTEEFRSKWVRTSTANGVQILVISDEGINALKSMVLGGNQTENLGANNVSLESDQFGLNEQFEMELKIKNDQIEKLQKLLDQSQQLLLNEQKKTQAFVELEGTTRDDEVKEWKERYAQLEENRKRIVSRWERDIKEKEEYRKAAEKIRRGFWIIGVGTIFFLVILIILTWVSFFKLYF